MLKHICTYLIGLAVACAAALTGADTITMKDGQVLEGTVAGRAGGMVTLEIGGQQLKIPEANIASVQVTMGESPAPAAEPAPAPPPPPPEPKAAPTVAVGTRLVLRMTETLDSKKHKAGHRFTAKLEADLVAEGLVVAPRGTTAYGVLTSAKQSGRVAGSSEMTVAITDLLINNQMHAVATQPLQAKTENTAKQSTKRVARAAAIGGLAKGSKGAKNMAKVGVGASILTSGNSINIPAGTLVETQFRAPLTANWM